MSPLELTHAVIHSRARRDSKTKETLCRSCSAWNLHLKTPQSLAGPALGWLGATAGTHPVGVVNTIPRAITVASQRLHWHKAEIGSCSFELKPDTPSGHLASQNLG